MAYLADQQPKGSHAAGPQGSNRSLIICRVALAGYLVLLTAGLIARNPFVAAGSGESWLRKFYFRNVEWCGHFLAFAVLGFLCLASCASSVPPSRKLWVVAGLMVYAIAMEGAQWFVPPRTVEWKDVLQNVAGLVAGAAVFAMVGFFKGRRTGRTAEQQNAGSN